MRASQFSSGKALPNCRDRGIAVLRLYTKLIIAGLGYSAVVLLVYFAVVGGLISASSFYFLTIAMILVFIMTINMIRFFDTRARARIR
jgi:hypothetical protein